MVPVKPLIARLTVERITGIEEHVVDAVVAKEVGNRG
jgi:hypothetical protein